MKYISFLLLFLLPFLLNAQPGLDSLQQQWVQSLKTGKSTAEFYWDGKHLFYSNINTSDAESVIQMISSKSISGLNTYAHIQTYRHDDFRFLTVGTLHTKTDSLLLLSAWRDVDGDWKKEIDLILTQQLPSMDLTDKLETQLRTERKKWVELANQHNPETHIKATYAKDASYLSNGSKSEGQDEIIDRYSYMENPNYQVDLVPKALWQVSEQQVMEIGRYFTGPKRVGDGGLYVILWEQQEVGRWLIELDFNF